ncbi:S8 family serine peptidase [Gloeocapsa sp. PCC 73106]|uniref:S8 family serine peptidase n=1 Tax=Gloeocapsa sp. PCC 73106 TaxID=102232 RepID=UPI0002ABB61C|nr:S8 family serine peptidase [Gloeocapsa sp. PCC 73106]ELR99711.1 subtilisin-like serine protease [Gloeocapsa sp. PCC 73106]
MRKKWKLIAVSFLGMGLMTPVIALEISVGFRGINASKLHQEPYNLTGRKIAIGQVEIGRPGKVGWDKLDVNSKLNLAGVFERDRTAQPNNKLDSHAHMVAMVMVSQDKRLRGVAPDARLYSGAVGPIQGGGQAEECLTTQHIAQQNGTDVRAINFSFGESLHQDSREEPKLDGNALLTQCIDWSARVHNTLYIIAGNQGTGGIPIPTDNYNGITTAYTAKRQDRYIKVDFGNLSAKPQGIGSNLIAREINTGPRRAVSLVAPGHQLTLYNLQGKQETVTGTSFAAPHITASVALLQEYGDRQIAAGAPNWSIASRRHEVTKAVLLNSADKIQDSGDGRFLGMERTTLTKNNRTWLESDAYHNESIALDLEMGTGHLNAFRAYQQLSAGQWTSVAPVPTQGWDYGEVKTREHKDYLIEEPLRGGSYVAITLVWNRWIELKDSNQNGQYDLGEGFRDRGLNNLDLYLIPADGNEQVASVCASRTVNDSVEHIFCPIPQTGRYKIRVSYNRQLNYPNQSYALAWWTQGLNHVNPGY